MHPATMRRISSLLVGAAIYDRNTAVGTESECCCVQYLDMRGRPGLLRTILEAQETRGLTRSDDISRLLPSEV